MIRLFDYLFFLRPVLFFPAWSTMLIVSGYFDLNITIDVFISSGSVMGASFIINQIQDVESDRINNKCHFLSDGKISIQKAIIYSVFLVIVCFYLTWLSGLFNFYMSVAFFTLTGIMYNLKPFKFKQYKWLGAISNYLMGFVISWFVIKEYNVLYLNEIIVLSNYNFVIYILTTLPDKKGDLQTNKETIGNFFGTRISVIICSILSLLNVLYSFFFLDQMFTIICIVQTILLLFQIIIKKTYIITIIKLSLITQALIALWFYPLYIFPILFVYFVGRLYYKSQFNLEYPSLKNE